jgi:hypothetical protein
MDTKETTWETLSHEEKNHQLFVKQKELLELFLTKRAISRKQYEKSLHDLMEKTGFQD